MVRRTKISGEPLSRQYIKGRRVTEKVNVSEDMSKEIEQAAHEDGYTKSAFMGRIIRDYLQARRQKKTASR
jgi:metal-responsive CopG/Arc/MetJ family transcriptional regulator